MPKFIRMNHISPGEKGGVRTFKTKEGLRRKPIVQSKKKVKHRQYE